MTRPDTKHLRELLAKASPRPWRHKKSFWIECDSCGEESSCHDIASCDEYETAYIQACGMERFAKPNAALIVAAVNALPALLDYVEALEKQGDRVRDMVQRQSKPAIDVTNEWDVLRAGRGDGDDNDPQD